MKVSAKTIQNTLSTISPISIETAERLVQITTIILLNKNDSLTREDCKVEFEFFVLNGIVRTYILNSEGEEITTNLHTANQAVTPSLLRVMNRLSYVNIQVISENAEIMCFSIDGMEEKMQNVKDLEIFGHTLVMHDSLMRAERELVLAKYKGMDKLLWFREKYKGLENQIPHHYIASFLGMTATSLSRLRGI